MTRREEWRRVLESEVKRWSALPGNQIVGELSDVRTYEVELDSKRFQVEVQLLENADKYLHVLVSVDDGSLPLSISPAAESFILSKTPSSMPQ